MQVLKGSHEIKRWQVPIWTYFIHSKGKLKDDRAFQKKYYFMN
jgi:hypothetical protein